MGFPIGGNRTRDIKNQRLALYQLSYEVTLNFTIQPSKICGATDNAARYAHPVSGYAPEQGGNPAMRSKYATSSPSASFIIKVPVSYAGNPHRLRAEVTATSKVA